MVQKTLEEQLEDTQSAIEVLRGRLKTLISLQYTIQTQLKEILDGKRKLR